jgi:hypothetical protein
LARGKGKHIKSSGLHMVKAKKNKQAQKGFTKDNML